jgi:ribosomal protein L40E
MLNPTNGVIKMPTYVCSDCGWRSKTKAYRIRCARCGSLNLRRKLSSGGWAYAPYVKRHIASNNKGILSPVLKLPVLSSTEKRTKYEVSYGKYPNFKKVYFNKLKNAQKEANRLANKRNETIVINKQYMPGAWHIIKYVDPSRKQRNPAKKWL